MLFFPFREIHIKIWFFKKKICNHPVEDINGKFKGGGQVTVVGIPEGVCQNLRENSDFQGVSPKKIKIAYVHKV